MTTASNTSKIKNSLRDRIRQRQTTLLSNLSKDFSVEAITKSPARFNIKKLQDVNAQFVRMLSLEEFVFRAQSVASGLSVFDDIKLNEDSSFCFQLENAHRHNLPLPVPSQDEITQYCAWCLDKNRVTVLSEFGSESACILDWQIPALQDVQWKKSSLPESLANLVQIRDYILNRYPLNPHRFPERIDQVEFYLKESASWWEQDLKNWLTTHERPAGDYLWPLRVALSGQTKSPSPFEILGILTKEQTHRRINTVCNLSHPE